MQDTRDTNMPQRLVAERHPRMSREFVQSILDAPEREDAQEYRDALVAFYQNQSMPLSHFVEIRNDLGLTLQSDEAMTPCHKGLKQ